LAGETDIGLARVGIRCASHTKDLEVAIWTSPGPFQRGAAAKILSQALPATSLVRVLTRGPQKRRAIAGVEVLSGKGFWRERLSSVDYSISAPSFFQVNTPMAETLIDLVLSILQPDGSDRVLDLYSGAGTFTLPLAALSGEVVAVESASSSVRDLRRNLEQNGLWAEVVGGDAAREIAGLGHFDIAVVDPPRTGLANEVIDALAEVRPRALAYVSCDPATLARDAKLLASAGMELVTATPVDLFPQTYHVETVAHFVTRPSS
jgi:23S rRNA (uracil1939-C5)-methyltransferase